MKKNIIFLIVDALMPSRTGFGGNVSGVSPELDRIVENSLYCSQAFSMGNPTEFALPGLFASSYLLDDGGYGDGIANRKITLAEVLQNEGYQTSAFLPIFRPLLNQYNRGFDDYYNLCDPRVILRNFSITLNWYKNKYHSGEINERECFERMISECEFYFSDIVHYCQSWQRYVVDPVVPESFIFSNVDYYSFEQEIENAKILFESEPDKHIKKILNGEEIGFIGVIEKIVLERIRRAPLSWVDIRYRALLIRNLVSFWKSSSSYRSAKLVFADAVYRILQGQQKWVKYPSAGYLIDTFKNWIEQLNKKKPFYAYLHLMDVHELNHYSFDQVDKNKKNSIELSVFKKVLNDLKNEDKYSGNMMYDSSISYIDHKISQLKQFLVREKLSDNTIIVISSDHGGSFPNIPIRDDNISHRVDCFYDELYKIPVIFNSDDIMSAEYTELISSVDIAPTILDMAGIQIPGSFKGQSILSDKKIRDCVIMENQGRGPCDLMRKPIRICVRSKMWKLVYVMESESESCREYISELYDLVTDPCEYSSLHNCKKHIEAAQTLIKIAQERIKEIKNK